MPPALTDLPRPVPLSAYDDCKEAVRERVERSPHAIAAYTAGEVRFPGHSDLDVFVVVADDAPPGPIVRPADLPPPGPYLANHSFPHYPAAVFCEIHHLFPLFEPLVPLVEKVPIEVAPPPDDPDDAARLAAAMAVDYLFKKVFRLLDIDPAAGIPIRTRLCHLHTVRYTLALVERATGTAAGADYVAAIDRLRGGWFELDPAEGAVELLRLVDEAIGLGFDMAWRLATVLPAAGPSTLANRETAIRFGAGDRTPAEALDLSRRWRLDRAIPATGRRLTVQPLLVPAALGSVLATYAAGDGPWSAWLARSLAPDGDRPPVLDSPALARRRRALDDIARRSLTGPIKNSYPYGFPDRGVEGAGRRLLAALVGRHARRFARAT